MSKVPRPIPTQQGGQERQTAVPANAAEWHPPKHPSLDKVARAVKTHGPKVVAGLALARVALGAGGEVNTPPPFQAAVATADRDRATSTREIKGKHGGSHHDSGVTTKTSDDDGKGSGFSPTDGKGKGSSMTVWSSKNPGPNSAAIAEFRSKREPRGKEPVVNGQKGNQTADRFFHPPSHSVQEVFNRGNDQGDTAEAFLRGLFFGRFLTGCAVQAPTTLVYETVQSERPSPLPTATLTLDQGNSDQVHLVSFETDKVLQNKVIKFQEATRELLYRQFGDKSYTKWEITYTVDDASYNNLVRDQFPSFFVTNLATGERYVPAFWGEPGNIGFVAVPQRAQWIRVTSTQDDSSFLGPHEPTMVYMDDMDVLNGRPIPRVYNRDIGAYLDFNLIPDFSAQDEERFVQTFVDAFNANRSALRNIAEEQHGLDAKDNPQKIVAFSPVYRPDGSVRFLLEDQTRGGRQDFIIRSDGKKVAVPPPPNQGWRRVLDPINGVYNYEKQVWNGDEYTWEVVAVFVEDSGLKGEIINLSLLRPAQPEAKVTTTPIVIEPTQTVSPTPDAPTPDLKSPTLDAPTPELASPTPPDPTPEEKVVTPSPSPESPTIAPTVEPTKEKTKVLEVKKLPELRLNGWTFEAEGKPVLIRGAVVTIMNFNPRESDLRHQKEDAIRAIRRLSNYGIKSVSIYWNLAEVDNPEYVADLMEVLKEARKSGMRVLFTPHSNGYDASGRNGEQMRSVPPDFMDKWNRLFDQPGVMKALEENVDIISPVAELGDEKPWPEWKQEALNYIAQFRARFQKDGKTMLFAVSLPGYGSKVEGVVEDPIDDSDVFIDLHPYSWVWSKYEGTENAPDQFVRRMKEKGKAVLIGEIGPDPSDDANIRYNHVKRTLELVKELDGNVFWWVANGTTSSGGFEGDLLEDSVADDARNLVLPYLVTSK